MDQAERRQFLIGELIKENPARSGIIIPEREPEQKILLRALLNIRMPGKAAEDFLRIQDEYLREETATRGITDAEKLQYNEEGICVWKGDITTLRCGAIVNAANSGMTGCYVPNHCCIDNCIHTYAGVQLREKCAEIMRAQGYEEPAGQAKITSGYNLPCGHIIHTVGPIVSGRNPLDGERGLLASCYRSCLELAAANNIASIAFCCISTGIFGYPNEAAAETAVGTVREFLQKDTSVRKVIFNVFKDIDERIYRELIS